VEEVQDAGAVAEITEDKRRAMGRGPGRGQAGHFKIEAGLLESENAHVTPTGDGHGFDERGLGGGGGSELGGQGGVEVFEAIHGFAFADDGLGEDAVADAVLRGGEFAFGGEGASGFSAVGAGGFDFAKGTHIRSVGMRRRARREV
jgi:hypothetical protein